MVFTGNESGNERAIGRLDDVGQTGNTHGMMGETNNGEIAELIANWLANKQL